MRPVSARFLRTIRGSHRMRARVRVVETFQEGSNPTGTELPVLAGDVAIDSTADVRSTLDLETSGEWGELLTPYGNELFVERGIDYGNGDTEWVSLGYFRIDSVEQGQAPNGTIRVSGSDRMAQVIDSRLPFPEQYAAGTSHEALFEALISTTSEAAPFPEATVEFDYDASAAVLGAAQLAEESRFEFLRDAVLPEGKVMFWDHRGFLVVRSAIAPGGAVFDIDSGREGVILSLGRELGRSGVYNGVVARGESPDGETTPPVALAINDNPTDPIRWGGPFGKVTRFYASSFITTDAQAESAAASLLSKYTGLPYTVDLTAVPNPALEPLDVIHVTLPGGFEEDHVIESLTIPLTADGVLQLRTRTKNLADEEEVA
jgi:hypothetical protein